MSPNPINQNGGVCNHSTPAHWKPLVIFCVGNKPAVDAEFQRSMDQLGVGYKVLQGSYKGVTETSYCITLDDFEHVADWIVDEESVLMLSAPEKRRRGWRAACLLYPSTGATEDLGIFRDCTEAEAMACDGWTYDPSQGAYFICEHVKNIAWRAEALAALTYTKALEVIKAETRALLAI